MSRVVKRPTTRPAPESGGGRNTADKRGKTLKRATNLTLDPEAVARGERYGQQHGTSLSQLVNGFLHGLPASESEDEALAHLSPVVRRLYGVAAGGTTDREAHRAHLLKKHGSRG